MISSLTALFVVFAAVLGSTAMAGVIAYFLYRLKQIESKTGGVLDAQLADQLEATQAELLAVQQEVAALTERVDFTERLLEGPRPETDQATAD